jgi:hypothetical protein
MAMKNVSGGGRGNPGGTVSVSVRSKSVDTGTKRMVKKQNRAAESYKIKDMDAAEKGAKYRAERKLKDADAKAKQLKKAELTGLVKGAAATAAVGAAAKLTLASKEKKKAKPTATPKAKPKLTQSEKDFLEGQKLKAKIMKKTGVYPNTAN